MKRKPLALDLFCGGGGSCIGMQRAGFEVVGIDIKPHKNYPGHFIQADIHNLPVSIDDFDFVWASPPCQRFSIGTQSAKDKDCWKKHPDLLPVTREILSQHPMTCIENVSTAPMYKGIFLNAPSVGLNWMNRKRIFETSFWIWQPALTKPQGIPFTIWKNRSATNENDRKRLKRLGLPPIIPKDVAKAFMGIPQEQPMTNAEIGEAVAPPMAEYIAKEALRQMNNGDD